MDTRLDERLEKPPRVFICYSNESLTHRQRVLALADALRHHGIDAELDLYHVHPPQGWPRWCEEQLRPEKSRFVLLVCTAGFRERVEGKITADEGRGFYWEGTSIYNYLYDGDGKRFIPVLFGDASKADIPLPLQGHTRYRTREFDFNDPGYQALYRELTDQPEVERPSVGDIVQLPRNAPTDLQVLGALEPRKAAHATRRRPKMLDIICMVIVLSSAVLLGCLEYLARRPYIEYVLTPKLVAGSSDVYCLINNTSRQTFEGLTFYITIPPDVEGYFEETPRLYEIPPATSKYNAESTLDSIRWDVAMLHPGWQFEVRGRLICSNTCSTKLIVKSPPSAEPRKVPQLIERGGFSFVLARAWWLSLFSGTFLLAGTSCIIVRILSQRTLQSSRLNSSVARLALVTLSLGLTKPISGHADELTVEVKNHFNRFVMADVYLV